MKYEEEVEWCSKRRQCVKNLKWGKYGMIEDLGEN